MSKYFLRNSEIALKKGGKKRDITNNKIREIHARLNYEYNIFKNRDNGRPVKNA